MLTCPNCKKELAPATTPCPRCRADLTLLVDYMDNVDEQLSKADSAMKSGELGSAVWAYLNVLETDPENPIARRQVLSVATAIRNSMKPSAPACGSYLHWELLSRSAR